MPDTEPPVKTKRVKARQKSTKSAARGPAPASPTPPVAESDEAIAAPLPVPPTAAPLVIPVIAEDGASLEADHVQLRLSAVGRVEAEQLAVTQGAVGAARVEQLSLDRSAVGAVLADRVEIGRSYARSILARQVQMDRSAARVVIAADVNTQGTTVMFLIARRVAGEVRVLFDWRGAVAFGAAVGFVVGLFRLGARRRQATPRRSR